MNIPQYTAKSALDKPSVKVEFSGTFRNQPVKWHAEICSIEYAQQHYPTDYPKPQQFLDVRVKDDLHLIRVGLPLDRVSHADILKTIIMIQNYKLLNTGLHWFRGKLK